MITAEFFPWGVMSGDMTPDSVIIQARLDPAAWQPDKNMTATVWEMAGGPPVATYTIPAAQFGPDKGGVCKLPAMGLEPSTWYAYQFGYGGLVSAIGVTRTLPAPTTQAQQVRVAILTCNHYQQGYWQVLSHVAAQEVDCIIHTGDNIYETALSDALPDRPLTFPDGLPIDEGTTVASLADYQYIYDAYNSQAEMRLMHQSAPLMVMRSDHEFVNDCYWVEARQCHTSPTHPRKDDPPFMRQLWADSMTAFFQGTPMRAGGPLYRSIVWGDLAEFLLLDGRSYRNGPPCGGSYRNRVFTPGCPEMNNPARTMLGDEQLAWLLERLANSTARWKIVVSPCMVSDLFVPGPDTERILKLDGWQGYPSERQAILDALPEGAVVFSGDLHAAMQAVLRNSAGEEIAREYMTPAASSATIGDELLGQLGLPAETHQAIVRGHNQDIRFFNGYTSGYLLATINRERVQVELFTCDARQADSLPTLAQTWYI